MQSSQQETKELDISIERIKSSELARNDLILHKQEIWKCESVNMQLFSNCETKAQTKISPLKYNNESFYLRCEKLELIPKEWKMNMEKVELKGQELGLGPIHQIQVVGMRQFKELEVVKSCKEKGQEIAYKVILCKTNQRDSFMIVAVEFIN